MLSAHPGTIQITPHHPSPLKGALSSDERKQSSLVSTRTCCRILGFSSGQKEALESLRSVSFLRQAAFMPIKVVGDKKINQEVCCNFIGWRMEACSNTSFFTFLDTYRLQAEFNWRIYTFCRCIVGRKFFRHFSSYYRNKVLRYGKKFPGSPKNVSPYCSKYSV